MTFRGHKTHPFKDTTTILSHDTSKSNVYFKSDPLKTHYKQFQDSKYSNISN